MFPTCLQDDQLNKAVLVWYQLYKVTSPVYATVHVNNGKVPFAKVPEKHGHV